jgi:recombinational DNA repair ATPase RecF
MIRCDELIDVSADIKEKRKEMIQNVQTIVTKLESKVPLESNSNENENALVIYDPSRTIPEQ